jgi:hypothetical protein
VGRDFALLNVIALHHLTRAITDRAMEQKGGQKPSRRSTPTVSDWLTGHMHNQSSLCIHPPLLRVVDQRYDNYVQ